MQHDTSSFTWNSYNSLLTSIGNAGCFKKEFYNGTPNVTLWRMLRKRLHLKAYKLSKVSRCHATEIRHWAAIHYYFFMMKYSWVLFSKQKNVSVPKQPRNITLRLVFIRQNGFVYICNSFRNMCLKPNKIRLQTTVFSRFETAERTTIIKRSWSVLVLMPKEKPYPRGSALNTQRQWLSPVVGTDEKREGSVFTLREVTLWYTAFSCMIQRGWKNFGRTKL
jgi:hypothetical protein